MPNWCSNTLVVGEGVESFRENAIRDGAFLLAHVLPMPQELLRVHTGSKNIDGRRVERWIDTPDGPVEADAASMLARFGAPDWYQWATQNWGTKWDVSEAVVVDAGGVIIVRFDTACGPPLEWLAHAISRFPEWSGTLAYAEGGAGFWGSTHFAQGMIISEEGTGDFWREDATEEMWEEGPPVSDAVQAHLDRYGLHTGG
jgi:hypothetical protein